MIKLLDLSVIIEYDTEKDEVVNYKTTLNGVQEKKTTTTKKSTKKTKVEGNVVIREDNKLILSTQLIEDLGATLDSKISIQYERDENKHVFPVIGLSESFGSIDGNKLTKSNTVSYRGKANETLSEFGSEFTVEPYRDGIFKLVGNSVIAKETSVSQAVKKVDLGIDVVSDTTTEIKDLDFNF